MLYLSISVREWVSSWWVRVRCQGALSILHTCEGVGILLVLVGEGEVRGLAYLDPDLPGPAEFLLTRPEQITRGQGQQFHRQ